jgi:murein DD-endopeptidase MepM/ murein hydrolase activator NlpD
MKKVWIRLAMILIISGVFIGTLRLKEFIIQKMTRSVMGGEETVQKRDVPIFEERAEKKIIQLVEPIPNFSKRISKKPFGIHSTPKNSPVQPEHFTGYHTGVDAEILPDELEKNFFVKTVADGDVVSVRQTAGYGGLVVLQHSIGGKTLYGIYGHLRLSSILIKSKEHMKAGDVIGVLGDTLSEETGGERKHLHFGLYQGDVPDIRGYVQNKEELKNWINPLQFF